MKKQNVKEPIMNIIRLVVVIIVAGLLATAGWWFFLRSPERSTINNQQSSTQLPPDDSRFRWGVQLRPYALDRYTDELMYEQLDLAQELGVGWVRLDWHNFNDFTWHDRIIEEANKRGLHVVLILEDIGVPTDVPNAPAKAGVRATEIATHFKDKIRYYQIFNEVAGTALKGPEYSGTDFARDYQEVKYREIRDWMKAVIPAISAADPDAKTIVSAQWTHTGFIEQLIKDGVTFDILGWNWFSDMGDDLNKPVIAETAIHKITLLEKLRGFGKELWITELNFRPDEDGMDETKQAEYLKKMSERIFNYQIFKGLFVFELLDQSEVKAKGGKPEYYGLIGFAKDAQGNWMIGAKKQAFKAYKQVVAGLSR
jgi:hypothetical protein